MRTELFGENKILRPSNHVERKIKNKIKKMIFKEFESGVYKEYESINKIIKKMMEFYSKILDENIKGLASIDLLTMVLEQYDVSCIIDRNREYLCEKEKVKWMQLGPIFRRALKFTTERIIMTNQFNKYTNINKNKKDNTISKIFIAAEELARLYMLSDSTYRVFKEESELKLKKIGDIYFDLRVNNSYAISEFQKVMSTWKYVEDQNQIDLDIDCVDTILKNSLNEKLGVSFIKIRDILMSIVVKNESATLIKEIEILDYIENEFGIDSIKSKKILSGFTITSEKLLKEQREIYSPKQEYRALYRGFFEVNYKEEKYLVWSKGMAQENFILLLRGIFYKKFPTEWKNKKVDKSINDLSSNTGKKFEKLVNAEFSKLNIEGEINLKKVIRSKSKCINIPSNVGEIDYLGINTKTNEFIVAECKMISPALEPRMWFDDISKFNGENGYI